MEIIWNKKKLGELAKVKGGKRLPNGHDLVNFQTPYPYIRVIDFKNQTVDDSQLLYLLETTQSKISNYIIDCDDVYISIAGTIGLAGTIPEKLSGANLTENAAKITSFSELDKQYLTYFLNSDSAQKQIQAFAGLAVQPKLALFRIKELDIVFPEIEYQKKIIAILQTIDRIINVSQLNIEKHEKIKVGLMQDLLSKGVDSKGNIRSFETHEFKDSPIGKLPKEWKVKNIKETTYLKGRIGWQGLRADEFIEQGPYLITGTDFIDGKVNWDTCYHITEERYNEAPPIQIKEGDLLITKDGTIGKTALAINCPDKAILNSGVLVMRSLHEDYLNPFMYYILNSEYFFKFLRTTLAGSTINHLYQNVFEKFEFPCPDKKEQQRIMDYMMEMDKIISIEKDRLKKYQYIKSGLMQDLLGGKMNLAEVNI